VIKPALTKPALGSVTWSQIIFRLFETFFEHASCNTLRVSTNFIIFGPTDQKLWVFEVFRRSLGRAGMCCNQWSGVDQSAQKWGRRRKKGGRQQGKKEDPRAAGGWPLVAGRSQPTVCQIAGWPPFSHFFDFFLIFFFLVVWRWASHFGRMGVQHPHFLKFAYTWEGEIFHSSWSLEIFKKIQFFLLNLEYT
jgi:hypothetical protein